MDSWRLIDQLFEQAREMDPTSRGRFLDDRCAGDVVLRARIERLLRLDSAAGPDFMEKPATGAANLRGIPPANESDPLLGCVIAGHEIKETIARGGMGTVYLAEQGNPRRDVALKVLQSSYWSQAIARRFEVESRILAHLRHPNIAQVYDAGKHRLETGPTIHYFAMEFVPNARPLTAYASAKALTQRERIELFLQLCDAVAYGHQKGVIHRDLKPANVLVGSEYPRTHPDAPRIQGREVVAAASQDSTLKAHALLKVIDFGIARTVDSDIAATTMHTEAGQILGTLSYMSPEQLGSASPAGVQTMDIDTRSDVYSLGVMLYELLTGRMPYDVSNMTIHSAARIICEQEPTRPSSYNRRGTEYQPVRGDLETVVLKCIDKKPARRYQSVGDLSADLRRVLQGEPISARRPTTYSRMLRWAARCPKTATAIACLVMAAAVGTSTVVIVRLANSRPYHLDAITSKKLREPAGVSEPRTFDRACLFSFSGNELFSWTPGNDSLINPALVEFPSEWGGGKRIVIGFAKSANSPYAGMIGVFDIIGPYDTPIWKGLIEQSYLDAMPADAWPRSSQDPKREYREERFAITKMIVADVFSDLAHPGEEIVAYFTHNPGSQGVLRVYDLRGNLLFQAWQDGGINEIYWMAEAKQLMCIAVKGDKLPKAYDPPLLAQHPQVIFAIQPKPGDISHRWIHPHRPDWWNGEWYQPVWCKKVCFPNDQRPHELVSWFSPPLLAEYPSRRSVTLNIELGDCVGPSGKCFNISAILDGSGNIVRNNVLADASLQHWRIDPQLPNPSERPSDFQLLDWNDINPPCGVLTTQQALGQ